MSNLNVNNLTSLTGTSGKIGVSSSLDVHGNIIMPNNTPLQAKSNPGGYIHNMLHYSTGNRVMLGNDSSGTTVQAGAGNLVIDSAGRIVIDAADKINFTKNDKYPYAVIIDPAGGGIYASGSIEVNGSGSFNRITVNGTGSFNRITVSDSIMATSSAWSIDVNGIASFNEITVNGSGSINAFHARTLSASAVDSDLIPTVLIPGEYAPNWNNRWKLGSKTNRWKESHVVTASFKRLDGIQTGSALALAGELYTLSGSQIFSSSAFEPGPNRIFTSPSFSASLFVFQKPLG